MLHLHAAKKLLNTSRLKSELLVTEKPTEQLMHDWYVAFTGMGWPGKTLVCYFHYPSLLMVTATGRSIQTTYPAFRQRLRTLLVRKGFPQDFMEREWGMTDTYVVGKTSNRSMLACINQALFSVDDRIREFHTFETVDLDWIENMQMENLHGINKGEFMTPIEYWQQALGCSLIKETRWRI